MRPFSPQERFPALFAAASLPVEPTGHRLSDLRLLQWCRRELSHSKAPRGRGSTRGSYSNPAPSFNRSTSGMGP